MIEIKEKRSLNSKHYSREDGQFDGEFHAGHIHYVNKLGFGDGVVGFRTLDYTLLWDDIRKGWYFNYGSFNPFIPEYADQTSEFRDLFEDKDQTIKYTPVCEHIKGRLVLKEDLGKDGLQEQTGENCVIYDNAYGAGLDLIYCFSSSGLKKLVRIKKGVEAKDYKFKFEVYFGGKNVFRSFSKEDVKTLSNSCYKLDITKPKSFDTPKQLLIGEQIDGKEWATYIRPFKAWFGTKIGEGKEIIVDIVVEGNKTFLVKNIDKEFLEKATSDVFTDTDTTFYSSLNEKLCGNTTGASWSDTRGVNGTTHDNNLFVYLRGYGSNNYSYLMRCCLIIDTSSIPDTDTVTAGTFGIWGAAKANAANLSDTHAGLTISQGYSASDTAFANSDYNLANLLTTRWATDIAYSSINASNYNVFTLNSSGLSGISKTGKTKISVRFNVDFDNGTPNNPASEADSFVQFYGYEQAGTSNDPYLSLTYSSVAVNSSGFFQLF